MKDAPDFSTFFYEKLKTGLKLSDEQISDFKSRDLSAQFFEKPDSCVVTINWVLLQEWGYAVASCGRDGGRPTEIGRQRLISNHLMRLLLRAMVVSDEESQAMTWRGMD